MMRHLLKITFFLSFFGSLNAQTNSKIVKSILFYSFSNAKSQQEVEQLIPEIQAHKGITEVKLKYKSEKEAGQFIVYFEEIIEATETKQHDLDLSFIKDLLIKNNYSPGDMRFEKLPTE